MKILFSPIGSTDPISNMRDGGMLHICRIYKPDKVYLYLSNEMIKYHKMDNRYCEAINKLGRSINHKFEVDVIEDENMVNVQLFNNFVTEFEKLIKKIKEENGVDEIIVNVSSGTPAMKSALQMLSMLSSGIMAIQVSTPLNSSNKFHEDKDKYDLDLQWDCNLDNTEFEDRSIESEARDMLDRIRKENIEKMIRAYDYEAALMLLSSLSKKVTEETEKAFKMAKARSRMDILYVNQNRKKDNLDEWFPIKSADKIKSYEYLLVMKVKLQQERFVDFIRDITPIFFSLSEMVLKNSCNISLAQIGWEKQGRASRSEKLWCLDINKLNIMGIVTKPQWTNDTFISANVILNILEQKNVDNTVLETLRKIRGIEESVRNLAAHEIVGLTEDGIVNRAGYNPAEIMNLCFKMARLAGISIGEQEKNAYELMNEELINKLYE